MSVRHIQIQALISADDFGGGAGHARGLARGLRACGCRVTLLCRKAGGHQHDDYDEVFAASPPRRALLWRLGTAATLPFWFRTVRRAAAHADAVIALSPAMAVATKTVLPHVPVVYAPAVLDKVEHPGPRRWFYQWLEQRALHGADRVLVAAPAVRTSIERLYGPLRQPVGICPLGVDGDHACRVTRGRAALGVPVGPRLLLTVGFVTENKGHRHIAPALARAAQPDWWWVIVGEGPDKPAVQAALAGTGLARRTLWVGHDPHVADWYAAAEVLLACSRHETFGLAIAEALAAGRPVVIPADEPGRVLSPLADWVTQHRLGFTFPRGDDDALARTLANALHDDADLRGMGTRAARFARSVFSWTRYAESALALLGGSSDVMPPPVPVLAEPADERVATGAPVHLPV